jgi:hypothetical protein
MAYHVVSPEQHEGILCERYHRYLNKVQKINGIQTVDYQEWMKNVLLAGYAWNAAPINGRNIIRSFAAKGREFRFPLEAVDEPVRLSGNTATRVVEHVETMFPAWNKQREILKVLLDERRSRQTAQAKQEQETTDFQRRRLGDCAASGAIKLQARKTC